MVKPNFRTARISAERQAQLYRLAMAERAVEAAAGEPYRPTNVVPIDAARRRRSAA